MNPLLELWMRGWYRLKNERYYPPHHPPKLSSAIYQHIYWSIRWQLYISDKRYSRMHYTQIDAILQQLLFEMLNTNRLPKVLSYRHFTKPKKDGTSRHLVEPNALLKGIQHEIVKRLRQEQPHPAAVGFRKKKSIADHVWAHADAEVIISADIQNFFPSTQTERVRQFWFQLYNDEELAQLLCLFTTYQGGLPQGAPTSPILSNLVNVEMDRQIANRVGLSGGAYTRYADDMVFSWHHRPPSDFERAIRALLRGYGYELHPQKGWCVYHKRDEPEITGAILAKNGRVLVPEWVNQRIGELQKSARGDAHLNERLNGYLGYKQMVEKTR